MADRSRRAFAYAVQAALLWLFLVICRALPVDWASAFGGWIGRNLGPRMGQNKKAKRNLERALPENSTAENHRIMLGMWDNLGRVMAEYPHLPRICERLEGGRLEIVGIEHIHNMANSEKSGILFSAHLANWEVAPFSARHAGLSLGLIYRAPNNPWVDHLIRDARDNPNQFRKGSEGARSLFSLLRRGGTGAMLVDQKMNDGIPVPFFGRDAMTAPAIAQFAIRLGTTLVPARTERLNGARFRITVFPPLDVPTTGDRTADELKLMTRINAMIEGWIRAKPEEWLWLHRRWPN
jgi:KDO2-lipid IV(A) lauroyltransferase